MALLLHQRYSVSSLVILDADEDWFPLLHVIRTSSSLKTMMPSFVNTETVSSSAVLPTLIRDVGKSWNVSACLDRADSF